MPQWFPKPFWKGEDVFIIGGGPSLRNFDWTLLHNEKTIGCNQAFRLGEKVCDICIFGDKKFILADGDVPRESNYKPMSEFKNPIVTNEPALRNRKEPWIKWMPRIPKGVTTDALGWNVNTGASAINLALILGAARIYLLGFDMFMDKQGKPNWHNEKLIDKPEQQVYERMTTYFGCIKRETAKKFPGSEILHITNKSNLKTFKWIDPDVFWNERKKDNGHIDEDITTKDNVGGIGLHSNCCRATIC